MPESTGSASVKASPPLSRRKRVLFAALAACLAYGSVEIAALAVLYCFQGGMAQAAKERAGVATAAPPEADYEEPEDVLHPYLVLRPDASLRDP